MSDFLMPIAGGLLYLLLAPILGGLLSGCDRIISARMQRRKGPPLLQPFYDFLKLWGKQPIAVNKAEGFYIFGFLLFVLLTGTLFFAQGGLLDAKSESSFKPEGWMPKFKTIEVWEKAFPKQ